MQAFSQLMQNVLLLKVRWSIQALFPLFLHLAI